MATEYDSAMAYHQTEIDKCEAKKYEAFHQLLALTKQAGLDTDTVINLWVEGTFSSNWKGWHERSLVDMKELAGWSRRDCFTCDTTTEHNEGNICQQCHTPVPEEVYA